MDINNEMEKFRKNTAPDMAKMPIGECVIDLAKCGEVISRASILDALQKRLAIDSKPACWVTEAAIEIIAQASEG